MRSECADEKIKTMTIQSDDYQKGVKKGLISYEPVSDYVALNV